MTKYFCDRCGKEALRNVGTLYAKKPKPNDGYPMVSRDEYKLLCDTCLDEFEEWFNIKNPGGDTQ